MASDCDNLAQVQSNLIAILEDMTAHPKPTYSLDGKSVSWGEYYAMIFQNLETVRRQIVFCQGPFEVRSVAY